MEIIMRNDKQIESLQKAVEQLHDCRATHVEDVIVLQKFGSDTVWDCVVSIFSIKGHPKSDKCYAWSSPVEGSRFKRRNYAVLKIPPIDTPLKAVQAAIIQYIKTKKDRS
jgi:hypothetical protein